MGMNTSQRALHHEVMRSRIGDWIDGRLLVRCGRCRAERVLPIAWLCHAHGGAHPVGAVVPRLRCRAPGCGAPPDRVRIEAPRTAGNAAYLDTKRAKLGHLLAS